MDKAYMDVVMQGKAIPGSSLASDPDNPAPYEKPPEYTNVHSASEWIFSELIEEDRYDQLINSLHEGIPVLDVTQVILFTGFTQGKWDVNLMTLLIEPVAYIIMALAERAGVDFVIERESPDDEDPVAFGAKITKERLERMENFKQMKMNLPFLSAVSQDKLDALPPKDMAEAEPEETEEPEEQPDESLLAPPQQEGMG
tara:strand:+ start:70 stop:666 length:597 start_codon:yes stop_codon:yes gene_type:complete